MKTPTQDLVQELFEYQNGALFWAVSCGNASPGTRAGSLRSNGYRQICINKSSYYEHRLIFLYHHGYLPAEIDHIDNSPANNRVENLREATHGQNQRNMKKHKGSSSQYKGVSWSKRDNRWVAYIMIDGKNKNLGSFVDEIAAALAYNHAAEIASFGEFAKLNDLG